MKSKYFIITRATNKKNSEIYSQNHKREMNDKKISNNPKEGKKSNTEG